MKLRWKKDRVGSGWISFDENGKVFVHVTRRGPNNVYDSVNTPTRYCVFGEAMYPNYCGDLPLDMPEEELQAMAITLWRMK